VCLTVETSEPNVLETLSIHGHPVLYTYKEVADVNQVEPHGRAVQHPFLRDVLNDEGTIWLDGAIVMESVKAHHLSVGESLGHTLGPQTFACAHIGNTTEGRRLDGCQEVSLVQKKIHQLVQRSFIVSGDFVIGKRVAFLVLVVSTAVFDSEVVDGRGLGVCRVGHFLFEELKASILRVDGDITRDIETLHSFVTVGHYRCRVSSRVKDRRQSERGRTTGRVLVAFDK
jgi:hypothetical protein